jgi:CRISPR type III-A-associated protein Csm2
MNGDRRNPHPAAGREPDRGAQPRTGGALGAAAGGAPPQGGFSDAQRDGILAGDGRVIEEQAERLARELDGLKRAQMRNFYGPLVRLRETQQAPEVQLNQLQLMRHRLAYMAAREPAAGRLREAFTVLIERARPESAQVKAIFTFAEAVVAYHRGCARD